MECKTCGQTARYQFANPSSLCAECAAPGMADEAHKVYMITTPLWPVVLVGESKLRLSEIMYRHVNACGYPVLLGAAVVTSGAMAATIIEDIEKKLTNLSDQPVTKLIYATAAWAAYLSPMAAAELNLAEIFVKSIRLVDKNTKIIATWPPGMKIHRISLPRAEGRICRKCNIEQPAENFTRFRNACIFCELNGLDGPLVVAKSALAAHNIVADMPHCLAIISDPFESLYTIITTTQTSIAKLATNMAFHVHFILPCKNPDVIMLDFELRALAPVTWSPWVNETVRLLAWAGPVSNLITHLIASYNTITAQFGPTGKHKLYYARVTAWNFFKIGPYSGPDKNITAALTTIYDGADVQAIDTTGRPADISATFCNLVGTTGLLSAASSTGVNILAPLVQNGHDETKKRRGRESIQAPTAGIPVKEIDIHKLCNTCNTAAHVDDFIETGKCIWCHDNGAARLHETMAGLNIDDTAPPTIARSAPTYFIIFQLNADDIYVATAVNDLSSIPSLYATNRANPRIIFKVAMTKAQDLLELFRGSMIGRRGRKSSSAKSGVVCMFNSGRATVVKKAVAALHKIQQTRYNVAPEVYCDCGRADRWYNLIPPNRCMHCMYKDNNLSGRGIAVFSSPYWDRFVITDVARSPDAIAFVYAQLLCQPRLHFLYMMRDSADDLNSRVITAIMSIRAKLADLQVGHGNVYKSGGGQINIISAIQDVLVEIDGEDDGRNGWSADMSARCIMPFPIPAAANTVAPNPVVTRLCLTCGQFVPTAFFDASNYYATADQCAWCYDMGREWRAQLRKLNKIPENSAAIIKQIGADGEYTIESGLHTVFIAAPGGIGVDGPGPLRIGATYYSESALAEMARNLWGESSIYFSFTTSMAEEIMSAFNAVCPSVVAAVDGLRFPIGIYYTTMDLAINLLIKSLRGTK